jgi:hypothetical protein
MYQIYILPNGNNIVTRRYVARQRPRNIKQPFLRNGSANKHGSTNATIGQQIFDTKIIGSCDFYGVHGYTRMLEVGHVQLIKSCCI